MSKVQKNPPIYVCEYEREKRKRMFENVEVVLKRVCWSECWEQCSCWSKWDTAVRKLPGNYLVEGSEHLACRLWRTVRFVTLADGRRAACTKRE